MCDKTTPEGDVSYVDLDDESKILSLLADVVPESMASKTLCPALTSMRDC